MTVTLEIKIPNLSVSTESPSRLMSVLRARCIARYRMRSIPGRPEELAQTGTDQTISFGYIHGSVRVRQHGGTRNREWVDHRDITFKEGWLSEVYDYLDDFLGYITPRDIRAPRTV